MNAPAAHPPVADAEVDGIAMARLQARLDVAEHAEAQLRLDVQHRVRNMLAVVRALFVRSFDAASPAADAGDHFTGRLDAFGRGQVNAIRRPDGAVSVEDLVRDELITFGLVDGPDVVIDGPEVHLRNKAAELMGLAVHELATNAAKFGMLARAGGRLEIRWSVAAAADGRERLAFTWRERGVAIVADGRRPAGFGRELIEHGLPYQLGAVTSFTLHPGGLLCEILLPLDPFASDPESPA